MNILRKAIAWVPRHPSRRARRRNVRQRSRRDGRRAVVTRVRRDGTSHGVRRGEFDRASVRCLARRDGCRGTQCCTSVSPILVIPLLIPLFLLTAACAADDSIESRYLSNVRQVTDGFVKAGEGYFSPDQKTIIYQAVTADYPFYQIYTQPLDGGRPKLVSTGKGRTTCSYFSPDGKRILYASSHLDPHLAQTEADERKRQADDAAAGRRRRYDWVFDPSMDIFEADRGGGRLRQLTDAPGYDAEGAYSPDGKSIAFCSTRDGDPDIYIMDADGGNVRQITDAPGYDGGPFISPDGRWVIFRSDRKQKEMLQIYCIGVDGRHEVALTDNVGVNWAPYWHPAAPYIIWTGAGHSDPTKRPNYDLWLLKYEVRDGQIAAAGPIERVTDHPTADVLPVFSPDGKRLMWTSNRTADHSSQLWIADFKLPK